MLISNSVRNKLLLIQKELVKNKLQLSVAESCTGGLLSAYLTSLPGASQFFKGSVVSYSKELKEDLLSVPSQNTTPACIVSEKTALFMAQGVKNYLKSDWSLAITGFVGPKSTNIHEEVGKVAFGLCSQIASKSYIQYFKVTDRNTIREQACFFALEILLATIQKPKED